MHAQNYKMKVCCIGAGRIGAPISAVMALKCPDILVTVVDLNSENVELWNTAKLPIHEPGLMEIVQKCRDVNLYFSADIETAIKEADLIFIAVNIPTKNFGLAKGSAVDLINVERVARTIAEVARSNKIVVEKSTVPVRAAEGILLILNENRKPGVHFEVLSNPEFSATGTTIDDLLNADRVLIGGEETPEGRQAKEKLSWIYEHWIPKDKILTTSNWSSELSKLAASAFLAQRISSINSLTTVCEALNADVTQLTRVIGTDPRIGSKFLQASLGFDHFCFQKDIQCLIYICESLKLPEVAAYWRKVIQMNEYQESRFSRKIIQSLFNTISDKQICIFSFDFKRHTKGEGKSPLLAICKNLLEEGPKLNFYDIEVESAEILKALADPCSNESLEKYESYIKIDRDPYSAASGSHAIVICAAWNEFLSLDYERIYQSMAKPAYIFDSSNKLNHLKLQYIGFNVQTIDKTFNAEV